MCQYYFDICSLKLTTVEIVETKSIVLFQLSNMTIMRKGYKTYILKTRVFLSSIVPRYMVVIVLTNVSLNILRRILGMLSNSVNIFSPYIIAAYIRVLRYVDIFLAYYIIIMVIDIIKDSNMIYGFYNI